MIKREKFKEAILFQTISEGVRTNNLYRFDIRRQTQLIMQPIFVQNKKYYVTMHITMPPAFFSTLSPPNHLS